jgi:hypothetical protein
MVEVHDVKKEKKKQRKAKEVAAVKLEEKKQDVKPVDVIQFVKGPFYIQF